MKFHFTLALLVLTGMAQAVPSSNQVKALVDSYYAANRTQMPADGDNCPTSPQACETTICGLLAWPDTCGDSQTTLSVLDACRGNYSGACVTTACGLLAWPNTCGTLATALTVAKACVGNYDGSCISTACGQLAWPDTCGDTATLQSIAAACGGHQ